MMELITLVIYDITDNELRQTVAKYLKQKGLKRIQKSAFAGPLTSSQRSEIVAGLSRIIRGKDKVNIQIYPLSPSSFNQRIILGVEIDYEKEDVVI